MKKQTNHWIYEELAESKNLFPWEISWESNDIKFPRLTHPRSIWDGGDPIHSIRFSAQSITFHLSGNRQQELPSTEFLHAQLHDYYYGHRYPTNVMRHLKFIFSQRREYILTGWIAQEMGYSSGTILYKVGKLYDENPTLSEEIKTKRALNIMAYGDSLLRQMKQKDAIKIYRKALTLSDMVGECAIKIGDIFFEQNKFEQAADAYHEGLSIDSDNPILWRQLGHCQLKLGYPKEAAEMFKEAVNINEDDLANNWGAALAHAKIANGAKTAVYLNKCVKLEPNWVARIHQNPLLIQYYNPPK